MRIVIIGGGRGTRSLLEAIWRCAAAGELEVSSLTMLLNAYDNGASTGEVRRLFGILGPSDPRKNLQVLLDPTRPGYTALHEFFGMRFGQEDDADAGEEERLLRAMAEGKAELLSAYRKGLVFLELPEPFRSLASEGLKQFLAAVGQGGAPPDYRDFSVANALFAGLAGPGGALQAALDRIQALLPLRGRVVLNSPDNLYLYAVQEYAPAGQRARVLDEAEIVALRSSARIKSIFLLPHLLERDRAEQAEGVTPAVLEQMLRRWAAPVVTANPEALQRVAEADLILYGPGTLHSSLLPTYLTDGLATAIAANQRARKVLVCNIGEDLDTPGYTAADVHRLSLHYLGQGGPARAGLQPWDFFTDILINLPRSDRLKAVQPNVGYFEALEHCGVWDGAGEPPRSSSRAETRVIVADLEDEGNPGRHAATKLAALLPKLLTGLPGWHARFLEELTRGAIIFDVDETILDVRVDRNQRRYEQTLIEAPVLHLLVELLEAGFRLCAITGNDMRGFEERFTKHLVAQLRQRERLQLVERFEAYADGAARHATFRVAGTEFTSLPDQAYNGAHGIADADYTLIRDYLEQHAQQPGLIPPPAELERWYDLNIWKYHYDEGSQRWFEEAESGGRRPVPRVDERGDRVMLTLKPLPSRRHMRPGMADPRDIRREVLERLRADLRRALGAQADDYLIREAGWSSIDVTRGVSKATAVQHFMRTHKLRPQDVLYFGNEFGIRGNDRPVALGIPGVHVVSVNQPEAEVFYQPNIFYGGGRGTASAMQQLGDILERFREALATAQQRSPNLRQVTPVIQQKIEALYREKIERHERALHRRRESVVDRCFAHARRLATVDSLIRLEGAAGISLIIPAGGAGSRLQSDRPKPLFEVAGKPAFLYALEAFGHFADRIALVVHPEAEAAFAALLRQRPEDVLLVGKSTPAGDWEAVKVAFDLLQPMRGHVIVAWSDLVIANPHRIRETLDAHLASENSLTFPTAFERKPYAAVLRSPDQRPAELSFRNEELGGEAGYLEHDCSFFVFRAPALAEVLRRLEQRHNSHRESDAPVRFVDGIQVLHQLRHQVEALPICRQGDFLGFNERSEAAQISALINRSE